MMLTGSQIADIEKILRAVRPVTGQLQELNVSEVKITDNAGGAVVTLRRHSSASGVEWDWLLPDRSQAKGVKIVHIPGVGVDLRLMDDNTVEWVAQ